jgi:hypothetical protein
MAHSSVRERKCWQMFHYKQVITFSEEFTETKSNAVSIVCPPWLQFVSVQSIDMCNGQLTVHLLSFYFHLNLFYRQSYQRIIVLYMKLIGQMGSQLRLLTHLVDIILTCAYHSQNTATWDASSITAILMEKDTMTATLCHHLCFKI